MKKLIVIIGFLMLGACAKSKESYQPPLDSVLYELPDTFKINYNNKDLEFNVIVGKADTVILYGTNSCNVSLNIVSYADKDGYKLVNHYYMEIVSFDSQCDELTGSYWLHYNGYTDIVDIFKRNK